MNLTHAIERASSLCRQIAAPDFGDRPLYVVAYSAAQSQSPRLACGDCRGWFLPWLDLILQPWLESQSQWQGRGVAFVVRDDALRNEGELIDVALHELCHAIDCGVSHSSVPVPALLCAVESLPASWEARREAGAPSIEGHGPRFIRTAAHVRYRAAQHGWKTTMQAMSVAGRPYSLSPALAYERALGSEAAELGDMPIRTIIDGPGPAAFTALWKRDSERRAV